MGSSFGIGRVAILWPEGMGPAAVTDSPGRAVPGGRAHWATTMLSAGLRRTVNRGGMWSEHSGARGARRAAICGARRAKSRPAVVVNVVVDVVDPEGDYDYDYVYDYEAEGGRLRELEGPVLVV